MKENGMKDYYLKRWWVVIFNGGVLEWNYIDFVVVVRILFDVFIFVFYDNEFFVIENIFFEGFFGVFGGEIVRKCLKKRL